MGSDGVFYNRLSRVSHDKVEDRLLGLWLLNVQGSNFFLNSVAARDGDFLVPDRTGQWTLRVGDSGQIFSRQIWGPRT